MCSFFSELYMYTDKLKFKNGKFKIMQIADVQDIFPVSKDTVKLITLAIEKEKPDLVVFTGDQIYGLDPRIRKGKTENNVKGVIEAFIAPLEKAGVPFAVTFGNHDAQCGIPNNEQYAFYKKSDLCVTGDSMSDKNPGTAKITIYKDEAPTFDLFLFDSGGQGLTGEYYPVSEEQLLWFSAERAGEKDNGNKPNFIAFQHIPVPEFYNVINRVSRFTKGAVEAFRTHKNEFYVLPDEVKKAGGFMHESPATPDKNSGEFDLLKSDGGCLAVAVGHDHINSFVAELEGIKLIYTQCAGFNVYGPKRLRGVRIFELDENNTEKFETHTVTFDELTSDKIEKPIKEFVLTHIPSSMEQVKRIAVVGCAGMAVVGAMGYIAIKKKMKEK